MRKESRLLQKLIFYACIIFSLPNLCAQIKTIGLPEITNYSKFDYQGGTQNWNVDQDLNGNVYFANNNGLLQFDGSTWNSFSVPYSENIRSVKVDSLTGRIYVGAYNQFGFFDSNPNGELVYHSLMGLVPDDQKSLDYVWKVHVINDTVFFQSFTKLYVFKNGQIDIVRPINRFQFSFLLNGHLYIQDIEEGLFEYKNGDLLFLEGTKSLRGKEIWGMFNMNDDMLITTLEDGLFLYKEERVLPWKTEVNKIIKEKGSLGGVALGNNLYCINTVLGGIIICNEKGNVLQEINLNKGLSNNTVLCSFIDAKRNLWLGLDNGISYININSPFSFFGSSLNFSSVYGSTIYKGDLYVSTNQGLFYHKLNNNLSDEPFNLVEGTTSQSWDVKVIDDILLCANNKGALVIDGYKVKDIIEHSGYYTFKRLPNNPNFVIGANYHGFALFEKKEGTLTFRNNISGIYQSSKDFYINGNNIWFKRDQYTFQLEISEDLQSFNVRRRINRLPNTGEPIGFITEINDVLYVVSNNQFYTFSERDQIFQKDVLMNANFDDVPRLSSIWEDKFGNLWFAYDNSLGLKHKNSDQTFTTYLEPFSRLAGNLVPNQLSITAMQPNSFFIGMINGLAHYDSEFENVDFEESSAFIRSFSYGQDTLYFGNPQQFTKTFDIPYKWNHVKFSFSSPQFENVDNIQYSYQLKPFDKEWSPWSKVTLKEYTNLREGDYTIQLKTKNAYGIVSEPTVLDFSISPPWYRKPIALLLYAILFGAIIYLLRVRTQAKIRRHKYYQTLEQRRIYLEKESKIRHEQFALEKEIEHLKQEKLKTKILAKDKELVNNSLQVVKKNKILNGIVHKLKEMDVDTMNDESKYQLNKLKKSILKEINNDSSWKHLEKHLKNVHFDFLKRLKEKHPDITPRELDLSTYLIMNMSTKEITEVLNISKGGVELARYRLRKKLNLKRKQSLTGYLLKI